ncbi:PH domain-containing protein [Phytomonospora sp. NPDC050363]|uniref:PH domain-containing protein n=1 Tax=Phytomonospora sp. NPDC050363 TaxID=3155642 RepID=UPI0033F121EB
MLTFVGGTPLALSEWWLTPILLIPVGIAVWAWRSGVDATGDGLRVRGLVGSRRFAWSEIEAFGVARRQAFAILHQGVRVPLPAVRREDLPRLIAASGSELVAEDVEEDDTED